jgi:hypothetical protein
MNKVHQRNKLLQASNDLLHDHIRSSSTYLTLNMMRECKLPEGMLDINVKNPWDERKAFSAERGGGRAQAHEDLDFHGLLRKSRKIDPTTFSE